MDTEASSFMGFNLRVWMVVLRSEENNAISPRSRPWFDCPSEITRILSSPFAFLAMASPMGDVVLEAMVLTVTGKYCSNWVLMDEEMELSKSSKEVELSIRMVREGSPCVVVCLMV